MIRMRRRVLVALLALGVAVPAAVFALSGRFSRPVEPPPPPLPPRPTADLRLTIIGAKEKLLLGDTLTLTFKLTNAGSTPLLVLPPLDGSHEGWRFPRCRLTVRDEREQDRTPRLLRCGNTNPLKPDDFLRLKAGEELQVLRQGWKPDTAGIYRLTFLYDSTDNDPRRWGGSDGPPKGLSLELLRKVASVRLETTLLVEVTP